MKWILVVFCMSVLIVAVIKVCLPAPPLLDGVGFSQGVFDENGRLLRITLSPDDKYRIYVSLDKISPVFIEAVLLQEDQYFYRHPGINPFAIVKAAWQTYILRKRHYGGSTITMQVARMRYGINSKNISGKIRQMIKALQLELYYSKKQILEAYFHLASYGGNIEGIQAASAIYYEKPASRLTLPEALRLCVVPQNPRLRAPKLDSQKELHKACSNLFQRWILQHPEDGDKQVLMDLPLSLTKRNLPYLAPHFVNQVLRNHHQPLIVTTLNSSLQSLIEKIIRQYLKQQQAYGMNNAAAMLVDCRTMEVKALIGSGNFFDAEISGQINGAKAKRSPGSALKPFIYALALEQGLIHPCTVLKDSPCSYADYNPENFDRDFLGPIKAKEALILSRNIPAIHLSAQLKDPTFYQFLQQVHVGSLKPEYSYGLSLVLGSAEVTMEELVRLYAMLANGGVWQPLRTCFADPLLQGECLLSEEASFLTLDMLKDTPRPYATHISADKRIPVYWKTGTSSGYRDAWSVGIFGPYALAVWIGNFNGKSNPNFVGSTAAAPLFFRIVDAIAQRSGPLADIVSSARPKNLIKIDVCEATGLLPNSHCPHLIRTWFIPGKSPIKTDTVHREVAIDPKTGWRTCQIDQNTRFAVYEFWPSDILKIYEQAGVRRLSPPPFSPDALPGADAKGEPPQIISPRKGLCYAVRLGKEDSKIVFSAIADGDATTLYWFVNNELIGSCARGQHLCWKAAIGRHEVRVVDNHGRTDARELIVQAVD